MLATPLATVGAGWSASMQHGKRSRGSDDCHRGLVAPWWISARSQSSQSGRWQDESDRQALSLGLSSREVA